MKTATSSSMQNNVYSNSGISSVFQQGVIGSNTTGSMNHWSNVTNFTTPVSEALYVNTSASTWAHTVPHFMPWIREDSSSGCPAPDPIIRFTAPFPPDPCTSQTATSWELLNNLGASKTNANLHLKRRNYSDDLVQTPRKQMITDEKMAARMQNLHISNMSENNVPYDMYAKNDSGEIKKSMNSMEQLKAMLSSNKGEDYKGSLVLAPEIKNLIEPEKLFAKTFINPIERPTMALVLWKPPQGSVHKIINSHLSSLENVGSDSQSNFVSSVSKESVSSNSPLQQVPVTCTSITQEYNPADISLPDDFDMEA